MLFKPCLILIKTKYNHHDYTYPYLYYMGNTAFNVACQSETMLATNENTSAIAMSIFSGIFNLGIGLGSFIGGQTINLLDIQSIGFVAGIIGVISVIFYIRRG